MKTIPNILNSSNQNCVLGANKFSGKKKIKDGSALGNLLM